MLVACDISSLLDDKSYWLVVCQCLEVFCLLPYFLLMRTYFEVSLMCWDRNPGTIDQSRFSPLHQSTRSLQSPMLATVDLANYRVLCLVMSGWCLCFSCSFIMREDPLTSDLSAASCHLHTLVQGKHTHDIHHKQHNDTTLIHNKQQRSPLGY